MNIKKIFYPAAVAVCFLAVFGIGLWIGYAGLAYHVDQPGTIDFSLFWDAYNKLEEKFIDPSKITEQEIVYGAIEGMTNSLNDPYTEFFTPSQAQKFDQDLSGSFEGIGVEIGIKKDMLTVIAPLMGTPGQKAGLKSGDIIIAIDGKDTYNITTTEAVDLIRGPKGSPVVLSVLRDDWTAAKDITIIRDTIQIPSLDLSFKEGGDIAYMQLYQFNDTLSQEFSAAARTILQSQAKGIVLDLRDNPGGYLVTSQEIAGWFLQKGQIVTIEDFGPDEPQVIYKTEGNSSLADYPLVILINQGSASASEILAGALRDNRGVKLIGTKSFGKGSVQEAIDMRGGALLKITIAHWLTPSGKSISEVGLAPNIEVEITEQDFEQEKDPQLDKALEIIGGLK